MPLGLLFFSLLCGVLGAAVLRLGCGFSWLMTILLFVLLTNLVAGAGLIWLGRRRR